jgi:hypothetical protein
MVNVADPEHEFVCARESEHPSGSQRPRLGDVPQVVHGAVLYFKCPTCGLEESDEDYSMRRTMALA